MQPGVRLDPVGMAWKQISLQQSSVTLVGNFQCPHLKQRKMAHHPPSSCRLPPLTRLSAVSMTSADLIRRCDEQQRSTLLLATSCLERQVDCSMGTRTKGIPSTFSPSCSRGDRRRLKLREGDCAFGFFLLLPNTRECRQLPRPHESKKNGRG